MDPIEGACVEHLHHIGINNHGLAMDAITIHSEEYICHSKGNAFIAIHKRMING
jgi:hypothetical protein